MPHSLVVYTVSMGNAYDLPNIADADGVDHICFTDQADLDANGWTIVNVEPLIPSDTFRSSREYKIRPHRYFANYEKSIYMDSRVRLLKHPQDVWGQLIKDEETVLGGIFHSFRDTVADEFTAVEKAGLDYVDTLDAQQQAYRKHHAHTLLEKPVWGGLLARRHNARDCAEAMEIWFANVLRYSRRDQLSLPLALSHLSEDSKNIITVDLRKSDFHEWATLSKPKPADYTVAPAKTPTKKRPELLAKLSKGLDKSFAKLDFLNPTKRKNKQAGVSIPNGNQNVNFGFDETLQLYFAEDTNGANRVLVSDHKRLALYKEGVKHRQDWLLGDYRLPTNLIGSGDIVVDVGANIGELGRWVEACEGQYFGFEPDPLAYRALQNNVATENVYDMALSDEDGQAEFYLSTATADSSLFKPSKTDKVVTVRKVRLDTFFAEVGMPKKIRLMKIEAEGMEPEVLAGAQQTLSLAEFVAVDAGPERGEDNTVPDVVNHLAQAGFKVIDCYLRRGTFLFARTSPSDI